MEKTNEKDGKVERIVRLKELWHSGKIVSWELCKSLASLLEAAHWTLNFDTALDTEQEKLM